MKKYITVVDRAADLLDAQIETLQRDGWEACGHRYNIEAYPAQRLTKEFPDGKDLTTSDPAPRRPDSDVRCHPR